MKKLIIVFSAALILFGGENVFGQGKYGADSADCIKYLSYYQEYYKAKNYDDALNSWRKAFKLCPPTASQNLFVHGATLMRQQINKSKGNPELRKALVDSLMLIYNTRIQYYPKTAVSVYNNMGLDMFNYCQGDDEAIYNCCKEIISHNGAKTTPQIMLYSYVSLMELYKAGIVDVETVLNEYENSINIIDQMESSETVDNVKQDIENTLITSNAASCDNLISLFTPRYKATPDDAALLAKIVKMLSNEQCTDSDLFYNAVNSLYKIDPSYNSAYYLYRLNSSKGNVDKAIELLEQAIAYDESDAATDADYYYQLAAYSFKNGKVAKAYEAAQKVAELDPSVAPKAYMICAQVWGSQSCGGDYISKRAPYWVAVDYLNKAKAADESLAEEANNLIRQYSSYFPEASEAFMYDVTNGQSYTVSCNGLRATTTVRTQK